MHEEESKTVTANCRLTIAKIWDALRRTNDGLQVHPLNSGSLDYTLKQLAFVMAYASEIREALEKLQAKRGEAAVQELARRRLADKSYTPSINEVLDNPDGFLDGFREG